MSSAGQSEQIESNESDQIIQTESNNSIVQIESNESDQIIQTESNNSIVQIESNESDQIIQTESNNSIVQIESNESDQIIQTESNNSIDQSEPDESDRIKRTKTVKTDNSLECLICHSIVKRIDRHLQQHKEILTSAQMRFILDFYRTKNAPKKKVIYDCTKCFRRFASIVTHRYIEKCTSEVVKVENPGSRSSLPKCIRTAIKSKVLPSTRDLEVAKKFVDYKTSLAKCGGEHKKWSQDRGGTIQLMAQMYNMTCGLRKPELLVTGCLDLQKTRNLKPQTVLNYLSTFLLFVDFCYLAKEVDQKLLQSGNEQARMKAAIRDTRRAFGPSAAEDYRRTAEELLVRVPNSGLVRQRYRQILDILTKNLNDNSLPYKKQQLFNFFLLQGRINTRFVLYKLNIQSLDIYRNLHPIFLLTCV